MVSAVTCSPVNCAAINMLVEAKLKKKERKDIYKHSYHSQSELFFLGLTCIPGPASSHSEVLDHRGLTQMPECVRAACKGACDAGRWNDVQCFYFFFFLECKLEITKVCLYMCRHNT